MGEEHKLEPKIAHGLREIRKLTLGISSVFY